MKYLIVDDEPLLLKDHSRTLLSVVEKGAEIFTADSYKEAITIAEREKPYVAFLDVDMPEMNGLELSQKIVEVSEYTNIVFVTGHHHYGADAWETEASAFVLKPLTRDGVEAAMKRLRRPFTQVKRVREGLFFRCFGNFEIFYNGEPLKFGRRQSKEFLAYLIDRNGAEVTENDVRVILWEEEEDSDSKKSYVRTLASDIRKTLEEHGGKGILISNRGTYAVDKNKMYCDYFEYENGRIPKDSFRGDYMSQFSWAEITAAHLNGSEYYD